MAKSGSHHRKRLLPQKERRYRQGMDLNHHLPVLETGALPLCYYLAMGREGIEPFAYHLTKKQQIYSLP